MDGTARDRALFLFGIVMVGLILGMGPKHQQHRRIHVPLNPIILENRHPGTTAYRLYGTRFHLADAVHQQIQGYASATSVNKGQIITFFVTTTPTRRVALTYTITLYRMGWYGGTGARLMRRIGPLRGVHQAACPLNARTGELACFWRPSYRLTIPITWTSGIYLAQLTNSQAYQSYIIFVVRDDARKATFLYQQPVLTYQAYNNWPAPCSSSCTSTNQAVPSGKSLYDYNSYGPTTLTGTRRAVKVSFDRPYGEGNGAGEFFEWEIQLVRWLERNGFDVTYATDVDTHNQGSRLLTYQGFFSAGHDEYWSKAMYDAVEQARNRGVNLAFFGANALAEQVRLSPSASGVPNRVEVCYKDSSLDPVHGPRTTTTWASPVLNRPPQQLIGLASAGEVLDDRNGAYIVTDSSTWPYRGTGLLNGTKIQGLVGYEVDTEDPTYPLPSHVSGSYLLLARSPVTTTLGHAAVANASIYQATSGAWVFDAGTLSFSWALDNYERHLTNHGVQRMLQNILTRFRHDSSSHHLG